MKGQLPFSTKLKSNFFPNKKIYKNNGRVNYFANLSQNKNNKVIVYILVHSIPKTK